MPTLQPAPRSFDPDKHATFMLFMLFVFIFSLLMVGRQRHFKRFVEKKLVWAAPSDSTEKVE
jgi:asparagine N-glycosylation enzyme membrane subunit Stt3